MQSEPAAGPQLSAETSYDQVPYSSFPFGESHPDWLATVATLFGMQPPPVATCKVLELACGRGGNLIPMALALPDAQFLGVDLSARQIADAQAAIARLGLNNVRACKMNILDFPEELGPFDFIIAHGVYSWVPRTVQDHILRLCRRLLTPHGVAFVSYNVFPGWKLRGLTRDLMLYHTRHLKEPQERINQAKAVLEFICGSVPAELDLYANILKSDRDVLNKAKGGDSYLFHELLEDDNQPLYFHEFMARAAEQGLQFLADADLTTMQSDQFPPHVPQVLAQFGDDILAREQYLDFLKNRTFRETLLCRSEVQLDRKLTPERIAGMHVAANVKCTEEKPTLLTSDELVFIGPRKVRAGTRHPITKAALLHLSELWPRTIPLEELQAAARVRLVPNSIVVQPADQYVHDCNVLAGNLVRLCLAGAVELHLHPAKFVFEVSDRPVASPYARLQAEDNLIVTNLRHEGFELNDLNRRLLLLLDGTRTQEDLLDELARIVTSENMVVHRQGRPVTNPLEARQALKEGLADNLRTLARAALLVG
jgi:methyltransferase-like protein/2-polyprenyl-3-methyl-5-hydroxy-6-metoxy-1,4-benzoquinol methylase